MKWENNRHIHIQLSYLESDQNRMAKRQYIRRWTGKWALGCLLAVSGLWTVSGLLAGCSEESVETSEELRLVLKLPPELTVDTRGEINNIPVNTIWVLQYATESGVSKLKQKAFFGTIGNPGSNQTIEVNTKNDDVAFVQAESRFYVIANVDQSFLSGFTGTEAELKAKTVAFSGYRNKPSLLTSGPLEYKPDPKKPGVIPLVVPLRRAYATISLSWKKMGDLADPKNPSNLVVKSVSLYNVHTWRSIRGEAEVLKISILRITMVLRLSHPQTEQRSLLIGLRLLLSNSICRKTYGEWEQPPRLWKRAFRIKGRAENWTTARTSSCRVNISMQEHRLLSV